MSFYTSLTGLNSATAQLAVTANNIANDIWIDAMLAELGKQSPP